MTTELRPHEVRRPCPPELIPYATTADADGDVEGLGQRRAIEAARFGLGLRAEGYHLLVVGPRGVGKRTLLNALVTRAVVDLPGPADWLYADNLAEPDRPRVLHVPAGTGAALRDDLERVVGELRHGMSALEPGTSFECARGVLAPLRERYRETPAVLSYLDELERGATASSAWRAARPYAVRVMCAHAAEDPAPIIREDHPTVANLVGWIDAEVDDDAPRPHVMRIHSGALHRANGGFLLLDAASVLQEPLAWGALQRALRTREIRIESPSLEPQPVPLDVKVVMFADHALHELLRGLDPELDERFKVVVDFEGELERTSETTAAYARLLATITRREAALPFDRAAIARVVEHASRLAGDARKLSLELGAVGNVLREAATVAVRRHHAVVTADDVQAAIDAAVERSSRVRDHVIEAMRRGTLALETTGAATGQINALTYASAGTAVFGAPTRITARARVGDGRVIDVEREVELGGPVHSKGVLILCGLLGDRYAPHLPLALAATIVFEQSYAEIEGDSASLAELCALLSAIGEVPLAQSIAVTGSIDQRGHVQAVGGVNDKIEGFYDVCRARGLTGGQGVIIPRANVEDLMLRPDVVDALQLGAFHVHAVETVDEALSILTGLPVGTRDAHEQFPAGSVNERVEARLSHFAEDVRRFQHGDRMVTRPKLHAVPSSSS